MGKVCLLTLRNSVIRFYLCLSITWTSASEVPVCVMNHFGAFYMGTRNETKTGKACQEWTSNSPHQVAGDITDDQFPDNSRAEAKNFCRNPQPSLKPAVWCYTMDPAVEWELCFECRETYNLYGGCKLADKGASYTGRLDRAISHMRCEPWSDHPDPRFVFPDGSAEKAENFCRNPIPSDYNAPWCYVRNFGHPNWEWCDICRPFQGQVTEVFTDNIPKHYLGAEFAGGSCIAFCITHQTCVVALIERTNHGILCAYATSVGGETIKVTEGHNVEQYKISRVCVARAKGAAGYFVNIPNVGDTASQNNPDFQWDLFIPLEECDKKCLQNTNCAMFNYYTKNSSCCILKYELDVHVPADGFMERHIVRCNPALEAINYEIKATNKATYKATNKATYKATSKAAIVATNKATYEAANVATTKPTNKAADEDANEAAEEANKPTSKGSNASKTSVAVPLLIVFLLLICAGLGFAYYKFVYKKDKTGSKEQKQLIAKKETGKDGKQVANAKPKTPPSNTTPLDKNKIKSTPGELPKNRKNATGKPSETVKSAPRSAAKLTKSSIITPKRKV